MPSTGLKGPYVLNWANVDNEVLAGVGVYALGNLNMRREFVVRYVGRSDGDLSVWIRRWVGRYEAFQFAHFDTRIEAFETECRLFHEFGGVNALDNDVHPARPPNTTVRCPNANCRELV